MSNLHADCTDADCEGEEETCSECGEPLRGHENQKGTCEDCEEDEDEDE